MKKTYYIFILILISSLQIFGQGIINNGANIYIAEGAYIVGGSFTNNTAGENDEVDLNGIMQLEGSCTNNSSGEVFINIENQPNGTLILNSLIEADIIGNSIDFENIIIKDSLKTLYIDDCNIFGILTIDGLLDLNNNQLIIQNNSADAITYLSGYILSETRPADGLSEIIWLIEDNTGTYNVPFGSGNSNNDLNIQLDITNAGTYDGSFIFATYPTDAYNLPLPEEVLLLDDFTAETIVDRYWKIESTYTINPTISLSINFANNDIDETNNPEISISDLKIIRYNSDENSWSDIELPSTVISNTVFSEDINAENIFNWWSLATYQETVFDIPNGITPNGDGYNDTWILDNCTNCKVNIYNRWGNKIYTSDNYDNSWDGDNNPSGAYFYVIELQDGTKFTGDVNIMKED